MKSCCFCGHGREWEVDLRVSETVTAYMEQLILYREVDTFYSGGMGCFDALCDGLVRKLKKKYPHISLYLVVSYLTQDLNRNRAFYEQAYDAIIFPELEGVYFKAAIQKRNRWMIDHAAYMIAYVRNHTGGARQSYQYARRTGIVIRNFAPS